MRLKDRSSEVRCTSSSRFSMAVIPLLSSRRRVSRLVVSGGVTWVGN
jgi:hypothetical protein